MPNYDFKCLLGHKRSLNLSNVGARRRLYCMSCGDELISNKYIKDMMHNKISGRKIYIKCPSIQDSA